MTSNNLADKTPSPAGRAESPEIDIGTPELPESPVINQLSPKESDFIM